MELTPEETNQIEQEAGKYTNGYPCMGNQKIRLIKQSYIAAATKYLLRSKEEKEELIDFINQRKKECQHQFVDAQTDNRNSDENAGAVFAAMNLAFGVVLDKINY